MRARFVLAPSLCACLLACLSALACLPSVSCLSVPVWCVCALVPLHVLYAHFCCLTCLCIYFHRGQFRHTYVHGVCVYVLLLLRCMRFTCFTLTFGRGACPISLFCPNPPTLAMHVSRCRQETFWVHLACPLLRIYVSAVVSLVLTAYVHATDVAYVVFFDSVLYFRVVSYFLVPSLCSFEAGIRAALRCTRLLWVLLGVFLGLPDSPLGAWWLFCVLVLVGLWPLWVPPSPWGLPGLPCAP